MHPERRPNPGLPPDDLAARLRALPPPPVPTGLDARLLATIPAKLPRRRRAVWAAAVGALAAACVLVLLAWPRHDARNPPPDPPKREAVRGVAPRPSDGPAGDRLWLAARRGLDESDLPPFTWPLAETPPHRAGTSTAADLLD